MKKIKTIYDLKLHEDLWTKAGDYIMRVPGGWIYMLLSPSPGACIFVPYNEEFKLK